MSKHTTSLTCVIFVPKHSSPLALFLEGRYKFCFVSQSEMVAPTLPCLEHSLEAVLSEQRQVCFCSSQGCIRFWVQRTYWVIIKWTGLEGTLKDHLVPMPLPWVGAPFTRPGCSILSGIEHFQGWGIPRFSGHQLTISVVLQVPS